MGRTFLGSQYGEGPVKILSQFCNAAAAGHYGPVRASFNGCYGRWRRMIFSEESQRQDWSFQTQIQKPPAAAAGLSGEASIKPPIATVDTGATGWQPLKPLQVTPKPRDITDHCL